MKHKLTLIALAAAAALTTAGAGHSQPVSADLAAYDPTQAKSPADTLVLCDAIAFLSTRPDVTNANVILARRLSGPYERLLPPDFLVGGRFYSETAERMFWRLRRDGLTRDQVSDAQERLARPMVRQFGRGSYLPMTFARTQNGWCNTWAREYGVRGGF
jgi:hypothetical protein